VLTVLRGLPGAGKSAVADELGRRLEAMVLSVDPIEAAIWRAGIAPSFETGVAAYEVAAAVAREQLRLGHDVVVDAVNAYEVIHALWERVATRCGLVMSVVEVVCSDLDLHRRRLEARVRDIDGFPEPTWDEVVDKQRDWQPWPGGALVLDSVEPLAANVERAVRYVGSSNA